MNRSVRLLFLLFFFVSAVPAFAESLSSKIDLPSGVSAQRLGIEALWPNVVNAHPGDRPKIILVLGGGGARGLSHIGVLRVLEEEHIPIDQIIGVSVGALIGSLYAGGLSPDKIELMANEVGWSHLTNFSRVGFMKLVVSDDLLSTEKMEIYLKKHIGDLTFEELKIPFACVATDIRTGERVIFQEGPVAVAARASATIPGMFQPVEYRHRFLVDGGLVDNLPTDIAIRNDTDVIIGVLPQADESKEDVSSVLRVLVRSIEIQKDVIINEKKKSADFLIEPNVGTMSLVDLAQKENAIEAGTRAARAGILNLKQLILSRMAQKKNALESRRP